jgi:hypothetical protein
VEASELMQEPEPSPEPSESFEENSAPDLTEPEAAMERRLAAAEEGLGAPEEYLEPEYEDEPEEFWADDEPVYEPDPQQENEEPPQGYEDPRLDGILSYLAERHQQEIHRELNAIAERYPAVRKPEMLAAVVEHVNELAERAGNPDLVSDPFMVEQAIQVAQAKAALAGASPAEQAQNEGAALLTDAPASTGHAAAESYDEARRRQIREAGPQPNPLTG